jgi:hypothetical protein
MVFRDAAIVATVVMILLLIGQFFPAHNYDVLIADPARYAYDLFVSVLGYWFSTFAGLTGLSMYAKSRDAGDMKGA